MRKTHFKSVSIYNVKPLNMCSTFNKTPEISAALLIDKLNIDSIDMFLDNIYVFSNIIDKKIYYNPPQPLNCGEHKVVIKIKDISGNISKYEWSFNIQDPNIDYNFYYGIPHAHTRYSDGRGTPMDAYEYARNNGLNFLIVTDHSNFLDGVKKNNYEFDGDTNQYVEKENSQWHKTRIEAELVNNKYKDFLALRGFEMSSPTGHINVINTQSYVEGKKQIRTLDKFFSWLRKQQNIIVSINHPGRSFKRLAYVPDVDQIVTLIEVGNGAYPRRYKNTEKYYFDALDMGWHLGAINGQDNHRDNWGDGDNLTVIVAENLSKDKFLEALRNRRTYSTETRNLKLTFKANNHWMGSIFTATLNEHLQFEIRVEDTLVPIKKIQLVTNGGRILKESILNNVKNANWYPSIKVGSNNSWFVIKVIHENNKCGISSPIFVKTQ